MGKKLLNILICSRKTGSLAFFANSITAIVSMYSMWWIINTSLEFYAKIGVVIGALMLIYLIGDYLLSRLENYIDSRTPDKAKSTRISRYLER